MATGQYFSSILVSMLVLSVAVQSITIQEKPLDEALKRDIVDGRLPRRVTPQHYNVELQPDIYSSQEPPFALSGTVEIYVTCHLRTDHIVLNAFGLDATTTAVYADPNSPVGTPSPILISGTYDPSAQFVALVFANELVEGAQYIINIAYTGEVRAGNYGLYWDSYVDTDGSTKYLVATQMEPNEARTAFPCFDEPDLKATFNITVVSKTPHVTLSNMPLVRTEHRPDGYVAHFFDKSPIMSSYQVCIAVGDFIYVEAEWENVTTIPVRIYARPQMAGKLGFAAKAAPLIQAWLEAETGIPYGLPKMDHIALPSKLGAMENWGLITYGEYYLVVDPETSAASGVFDVASIISHELAHQWYGNLVTCKWWNDIWLNEGLATFYNYYPQSALGWQGAQMQQIDRRRGTLQFLDVDQLNTSDPVRKEVPTVWDADASFSGSTYPKGGAMIRQLRSILSDETLKRGLTYYLNTYSFQSVTTDQFWEALSEQAATDGVTNPDGSPINVKFIMDAWLNQMGYPLLVVESNGDGTANVTSKRFFSPQDQSPDTPSNYSYSWNVPITIATPETTDWDLTPAAYLPIGETKTTISGLPTTPGDWFMINAKQMSFYRVDYDAVSRENIVNQLKLAHTVFPVESRAQYIDDSFTLSRTLYLPISQAMDSTTYLNKEFIYSPWSVALKHLLYIERFVRNEIWYPLYTAYIVEKIYPVYFNLGWNYVDTESPMQQFLRRDAIVHTCFYGDEDCRATARAQYAAYKTNPSVNSVTANNLPTILCLGVSEGDSGDWSMAFEEYLNRKSTPIREERLAYLFGMACSFDTTWQSRLLSYIVGGNLIDTRDANTALFYMTQHIVGRPIVWDYLTNSWNTVPSFINKFATLRYITDTYYEPSRSNEFNNFVGNYPPTTESDLESIRQIDKKINQNMDFTSTNAQVLLDWLVENGSSAGKRAKRSLQPVMPISPMAYWDSLRSDYE